MRKLWRILSENLKYIKCVSEILRRHAPLDDRRPCHGFDQSADCGVGGKLLFFFAEFKKKMYIACNISDVPAFKDINEC